MKFTQQDEDELRIMRDGKARIKKSNVILDSDDDDEVATDAKKNGGSADIGAKSVIKVPKKEPDNNLKAELQFSDLVRSHNGDLLFIQLPDHLPGTLPVVKDEKPETGSAVRPPSKSHCTLNDLTEGYFGTFNLS